MSLAADSTAAAAMQDGRYSRRLVSVALVIGAEFSQETKDSFLYLFFFKGGGMNICTIY